ncbi:hypothetical protein SO802_024941 [Lithocarpus litseifolius]|uniref:ATPase dynein-related AAA domain-containing protein n=1 Tax=Lithocarpus litseifolius TaxID=425828 RepID=A0AAW2BVC4_9ROSI
MMGSGPTSSGKTSLVQYLAAITDHEFVRINNHEHTDLQEYLGSYITDASGKLVFHEGVLVKAVRNGYWIVLDELNLAPSDVLEALNRLLDDNREHFVPELQETIRAHPDFMLFATQNPPTFYGGRKMLSYWFNQLHPGWMLTVRDLLSWVAFINMTERSLGPEFAFLHGAFLVLLDGLSLGTGISKKDAVELRQRCLHFLLEKLAVTIYSFMRFPRGFPSKLISVNLSSTQPQLLSYDRDIPTIFSVADMTLLEKLVTFSNGVAVDKEVSVMQLKASLHQNVLVRVAHHVANAQLMDKDSFKDHLQKPVLPFLNQYALQRGTNAQLLNGQKLLNEFSEKNIGMCNAPFDLTAFCDEDRLFYADLRKKVDHALQELHLERVSDFGTSFLHFKPAEVHCGDLWKDTNKSLGKRRAFSELLKLLESSGMSRHKSIYMEHLLLTQSRLAPGALDVAAASKFQSFPHETLVAEWKTANEYYFKSMASVLLLQQICLNSHKDITREQVDRSGAFLNQLIEIQRKQQELFDGLCAMLNEASLVLRTFEDTHLNTCHGVKAAANWVLAFIGKFVPDFQKSKEALDYYLLGQNRSTATLAGTSHCYVITKQMEQLVSQNFQAIKKFEEHLLAFQKQDVDSSSVIEILFSHFEVVFRKVSFPVLFFLLSIRLLLRFFCCLGSER